MSSYRRLIIMGRKLKFPEPHQYKPAEPAIICPAERVIGLYNQESGDTAQRISQKVRSWFTHQAHTQGWAGVHFLTEVQSNHGAGCVLWRPPDNVNVSVTITERMLLLDVTRDEQNTGTPNEMKPIAPATSRTGKTARKPSRMSEEDFRPLSAKSVSASEMTSSKPAASCCNCLLTPHTSRSL